MKIVAILGGGDWNDATVNHLEVPITMNLTEMNKKYRAWYHDKYCPSLRNEEKLEYKTFPQFLLEHGAVETDKVEEYCED